MDVIPAILRSGALTPRPCRRRWGHPPPRETRRQRFVRLWQAPAGAAHRAGFFGAESRL